MGKKTIPSTKFDVDEEEKLRRKSAEKEFEQIEKERDVWEKHIEEIIWEFEAIRQGILSKNVITRHSNGYSISMLGDRTEADRWIAKQKRRRKEEFISSCMSGYRLEKTLESMNPRNQKKDGMFTLFKDWIKRKVKNDKPK